MEDSTELTEISTIEPDGTMSGTTTISLSEIFSIIFSIICSQSVVSNILFLIYLSKNKIGSNVSMILIRAQSSVDLFMSAILLAMMQYAKTNYALTHVSKLDAFLCYFWSSGYLQYSTGIFSIYIVVLTAGDRFFAVVYPFTYRKKKRCHAYMALLVVLLFGMLMSLILMLRYRYIEPNQNHSVGRCEADRTFYNSTFLTGWYIAFPYLWMAFAFFLPVFCLVVIYSIIIYSLQKTSASLNLSQTQNLKVAASNKFTVASIIIASVFILSFTWDTLDDALQHTGVITSDAYGDLKHVARIKGYLTVLNFTLNPLVYFVIFENVRLFLRFLFCGFCCPVRNT